MTIESDLSAPLLCCCTGVLVVPAPPGTGGDAGEMSTVACCALDGGVVKVCIVESFDMDGLKGGVVRMQRRIQLG